MNKLINLLSVFCFIVLLTTSCEKEPIIELSQSSFSFSEQGGSQAISFSTNKDWSASVSGGTWCSVSPASGNLDVKSITVSVTANDTYGDRSATITIKAEELTKVITISQPKNKAILITKDRHEVGTAGGSISVELRANIEYDVIIPTENQSWITNTTTKGLVTSNLTFGIAANATYDNRQGKIIIKEKTSTLSDTVYVLQTQMDAVMLTSKTYNVADTAITISAELKSNVSYLVTIPTAAQLWITQAQTKALKTEQLQFNIARNTAFQPRSAEIIIRQSLLTLADTLYINQTKAPNVPTMTTYDPFNATASSVTTGGNVTEDGGAVVKARGVCWSTTVNPTITDSKTTNGVGTGTFTTDITGLEPATKYFARSYATNRSGTGYGNTVTFTTLVAKPTVTTAAARQLTKNSVVTGGNITTNGGGTITQRGVCWSTNVTPTTSGLRTLNGTGLGEFETILTGLIPATKYYIRAYATNSAGTSYGEQFDFTTLQGEPFVETQSVKLISLNTAEVTCNVTYNGGSEVTARGVCWSLSDNPSIVDNKTINGTGTGSFTAQISNMDASSTYYVRAYATNSIGTAYGISVSLDTNYYPGTNLKPVVISGITWAPVNVDYTADRTGGLLFQWGRKYGQEHISTNADVVAGPVVLATGQDVANKANFYTSSAWPNDWCTPPQGSWVTTYSPCPAGWRLPTEVELRALINSGSTWVNAASGLDGYAGRWFGPTSYSPTVNKNIFLPALGDRNYSNGSSFNDFGSAGYSWSSTVDAPFSRSLGFNAGGVNVYSYHRASGLSIRCVKN